MVVCVFPLPSYSQHTVHFCDRASCLPQCALWTPSTALPERTRACTTSRWRTQTTTSSLLTPPHPHTPLLTQDSTSRHDDDDHDDRIVRDLCELRCLRAQGYFGTFATSLPPETYARIHTELKLCQPQIYRCWLVCMWLCATADGRAETLRQYRLVLKAHLAARYSDWLQDCATPDERKRVLQDIYNEHIADWELLGAALRRLAAKDASSAAQPAAPQ